MTGKTSSKLSTLLLAVSSNLISLLPMCYISLSWVFGCCFLVGVFNSDGISNDLSVLLTLGNCVGRVVYLALWCKVNKWVFY